MILQRSTSRSVKQSAGQLEDLPTPRASTGRARTKRNSTCVHASVGRRLGWFENVQMITRLQAFPDLVQHGLRSGIDLSTLLMAFLWSIRHSQQAWKELKNCMRSYVRVCVRAYRDIMCCLCTHLLILDVAGLAATHVDHAGLRFFVAVPGRCANISHTTRRIRSTHFFCARDRRCRVFHFVSETRRRTLSVCWARCCHRNHVGSSSPSPIVPSSPPHTCPSLCTRCFAPTTRI